MAADTCTAINKKTGQPCTGKALGDTGLCLPHQPRAPKSARPDAARVTVNGAVQQAAAAVSKGVDPQAQARLHAALVGVVGMCCMLLPYAYRPAEQEIEGVLLPLERIWLRHQPGVGEINEDVTDALAAAVAALSFVGRVYLVPRLVSGHSAPIAGDGPRAQSVAAEPQRPAGTPLTVVPDQHQQSGGGAAHRTIEDVLSHIHKSSLHAGTDRRGDDDELFEA